MPSLILPEIMRHFRENTLVSAMNFSQTAQIISVNVWSMECLIFEPCVYDQRRFCVCFNTGQGCAVI